KPVCGWPSHAPALCSRKMAEPWSRCCCHLNCAWADLWAAGASIFRGSICTICVGLFFLPLETAILAGLLTSMRLIPLRCGLLQTCWGINYIGRHFSGYRKPSCSLYSGMLLRPSLTACGYSLKNCSSTTLNFSIRSCQGRWRIFYERKNKRRETRRPEEGRLVRKL